MIFDTYTYKIRGKHATYAKFLATDRGVKREDGVNVFTRIVDVYMAAAILGLVYDRRSKVVDSSEDSSDIPQQAMNTESDNLLYIYRLVMLLDTSTGLSEKERIDRAFKTDSDKLAVERNLSLFNSYVLGGIEVLYELYNECVGNIDDIVNQTLSLANSFIDDFDVEEDF